MTDAWISHSDYKFGRNLGQCQGGINQSHRRGQSNRTQDSSAIDCRLGKDHGGSVQEQLERRVADYRVQHTSDSCFYTKHGDTYTSGIHSIKYLA